MRRQEFWGVREVRSLRYNNNNNNNNNGMNGFIIAWVLGSTVWDSDMVTARVRCTESTGWLQDRTECVPRMVIEFPHRDHEAVASGSLRALFAELQAITLLLTMGGKLRRRRRRRSHNGESLTYQVAYQHEGNSHSLRSDVDIQWFPSGSNLHVHFEGSTPATKRMLPLRVYGHAFEGELGL